MTRVIALVTTIVLTSLVSASAEDKLPVITPEDPNLGRPVDFERDVYPILDAKCVACHNVAVDESKLVLEDVEGILKGGKRGPSVVAKKPEESWLFKVASRTEGPAMPPQPNSVEAPPLTPKELGILKQWILEGASAGSGAAKMVINWGPVPDEIHSSYSLALSPYAQLAAVGRANQIDIYNMATQQKIAQLKDPALADLKVQDKLLYPDGAPHQDFVHALAFHPSGKLLASSGYRVIKLWQQPQNVRIWETAPLESEVSSSTVSADGKLVAVGYSNGKVVTINAADGKLVSEFTGLTAAVTGVSFKPDSTQLMAGSQDKKAIAWNVADGAVAGEIVTPTEIESLTLNKDGSRLLTGHRDNIIRVWELPGVAKPKEGETDIQPLAELKGHSQPVTSLLAHPTDPNQCMSGAADNTARLWRLDNGQNLRSFTHGSPVLGTDISADGTLVVTAGQDGFARVWRADNGQKTAEVSGSLQAIHNNIVKAEAASVAKQKTGLADAAVKADEKSVNERTEALKKANEAVTEADKKLKEAQDKLKTAQEAFDKAKAEFDAKKEDKDLEKKFKDAETALNKEKDELKKAEEAKKVADNAVKLSDQALKKSQASLAERKQTLEAATQHQTTADNEAKAAAEAIKTTVKPFHAVAFSPDGKTFATAAEDGVWTLWSSADGQGIDTFQRSAAPLTDIHFVSASQVLTAGQDKQLALWNANPAWELVARLGPPADKPLDVADSVLEDRVVSLDFSPDGKLLASGGGEPSRNGELIIWDVENKAVSKNIEEAHSDTVLGVEFSYDGQYLVSGAADKFAKLFSVETGKLIRSYEGHTHHVMDVTIKKDNSEIATAGADNAIKIWNVETGEQKRTITNYSKQVTSIQYEGDKDNILSCGGDKTVRFHQTANGRNFRNFGGATDYQYAATVSRDGKYVLSAGDDGVLRIWNGTNGQAIATLEPPKPEETQPVSTTN
ncbi:MAG: PQQ-binding-like beta-propeller repeat protein [Planctomycetaceae bacterium]|nr:PQQ-binding-like beta-propeller repeat protein [Planctomycetaceae bacterium]